MRYGRLCLCIVLALGGLVECGCGKKAGEQMDAGRFEGPVYHNDYLGLTITLPSDWHVQDPQTAQQGMRTGEKIMAGSNENMRAALEAVESQTLNLVTAFKYPMGSPVAYNPQHQLRRRGRLPSAGHQDRRRLPVPRQAAA